MGVTRSGPKVADFEGRHRHSFQGLTISVGLSRFLEAGMHEDLQQEMQKLKEAVQRAHDLRMDYEQHTAETDPLDLVIAGTAVVIAEAEKEIAARRWLKTL